MNVSDIAKQEGIKVLFIHLGTAAGSFYRIIQYARQLSTIDGIIPIYPTFDEVESDDRLKGFEVNPDRHIVLLNKLAQVADLIVCSAVYTTKFGCMLNAMRDLHKVPVIMECDDDPFEIGAHHVGFEIIGPDTNIEKDAFDQVHDSDVIICSTEYLKNKLSCHHKLIYVIPNSLDLSLWEFDKPNNGDMIKIGWTGAANHQEDLSLIGRLMKHILDKHENVEFHCLHGGNRLIDHERFFHHDVWTRISEYPAKLASMGFDIALAPLCDSEFNRAKSNLRYLEYSALEIPCVASRVEPYKTTIEDGVDGYIANNELEWIDKIEKLLHNVNTRTKIGLNAFKKVKNNFTVDIIGKKYSDILKEIHSNVKVKGEKDVNLLGFKN